MSDLSQGTPIPPRGGIETVEMAKADVARQKKQPTKKVTKPRVKPKPKPKPKSLEQILEQDYPQYAFVLQNPELFGADVIAVLRRADKENWDNNRLAGALQQTTYWQTTVAAAKNFDALTEVDKQTQIDQTLNEIKQVSDVGTLDSQAVSLFARDMARRGIKGETLKTMTYQFIFKQGVDTAAAQEALFSETAAQMKSTAKSYGVPLSDDQIRTYLEQGKTPQDLTRMYRERLKAQYPHLSSQLDADLTFEDIVTDYRQIAARTLETSPDAIDFTKPEYMEAIAARDEKGNVRQLSLGEWQQKLRTDSRYGYTKTNQAVREAQNIASGLAKAFGRII